MDSTEQVLQAMVLTKQEKHESEVLRMIEFTPTRVIKFDGLLRDTYDRMCPEENDYSNRSNLVRIFNLITKEIYGNSHILPVVEGYGSFVMDIFTKVSDLDLSINFHDSIELSPQKKIEMLQMLGNELDSLEGKWNITRVQSIMDMVAEVPIIKVTHGETGIKCDLSVNNWDGIRRSKIIYEISTIDERFRKLCFLMKSWAKAHDINISKDGPLNSLSIILFVAFHLQTCNPPILPPFSILLKDGADLESVTKIVKTYSKYGKQNTESLAKLFITLLVKLASVQSLWKQGICVSVYEGSWISKSWNHPDSMRVEDFMDRSQNVARVVGTAKVETIYGCIHKSISYLSRFLNNKIQGIELMENVFGTHTVASLGVGGTSNISGNNLPSLENLPPQEKTCVREGKEGKLAKRHGQGQGKELQAQGMGLMQQNLGKVAHNALASFPPSVSYQPPLSVPSSNIGVHHGLGAASGGLVSWQSSQGGVQSSHQEAVAPNPRDRSFPPSSVGPLLPRKRPYHPPSSIGSLPQRERPYQPRPSTVPLHQPNFSTAPLPQRERPYQLHSSTAALHQPQFSTAPLRQSERPYQPPSSTERPYQLHSSSAPLHQPNFSTAPLPQRERPYQLHSSTAALHQPHFSTAPLRQSERPYQPPSSTERPYQLHSSSAPLHRPNFSAAPLPQRERPYQRHSSTAPLHQPQFSTAPLRQSERPYQPPSSTERPYQLHSSSAPPHQPHFSTAPLPQRERPYQPSSSTDPLPPRGQAS